MQVKLDVIALETLLWKQIRLYTQMIVKSIEVGSIFKPYERFEKHWKNVEYCFDASYSEGTS